MDNGTQIYAMGDWIVHRHYGVGQVMDIEKKKLNKKVKRFYKIRTKDSTFWLPVKNAKNSRVDPLPSRYKVEKAIKLLKQPPLEMSRNYKE
jgi:RNA polymerase-interacting CarD/CdnL/TRCF family regulator